MLTQLLTMLVQVTLNNLMRTYGALSVYGSDIALSVYGMMMKVYQIAHSMFGRRLLRRAADQWV